MTVTGQTINPIANFRFELQIEGIVAGWFTECKGVTLERETMPYKEGGVNDYVHQLPGHVKHHNLTLKYGVAGETLWRWLQEGVYDGHVKRCNLAVILYNTNYTEARRWDLTNAYPIKWTGSQFKSDSKQAAIETLELAQGDGNAPATTVQREAEDDLERQAGWIGPEIDVPALAQRVYDLLKRELRIERERLGR